MDKSERAKHVLSALRDGRSLTALEIAKLIQQPWCMGKARTSSTDDEPLVPQAGPVLQVLSRIRAVKLANGKYSAPKGNHA